MLMLVCAPFSGHAVEHGADGQPIKIIREGDRSGIADDRDLNKKEVERKFTDAQKKLEDQNKGLDPNGETAKGNVVAQKILANGVASLEKASPEQIKVLSNILGSSKLEISGDKVTVDGQLTASNGSAASGASQNLDLQQSQEQAIIQQAAKDKDIAAAVTAAAVTQSFVLPVEAKEKDPGIEKEVSKDQDFQKTQEKVAAAAAASGGPQASSPSDSSSSSAPTESSRDRVEALYESGNFGEKALDAISLSQSDSGSRDLSTSPLYNQSSSPEIQSALRDVAFSDIGDSGSMGPSTQKLVDLATQPGFQDLVSSTLGSRAQLDFNLATAGAAISANPALPPSGVALAQAYIYDNLSSAGMLRSSPLLTSLDASSSGDSLSKLGPETLQWIALAGDLAFADPSKLPPDLAARREVYRKGFEDFKEWLKVMQDSGSIALLDELHAPVDPEKAQQGWDTSLAKFVETHRRAKSGVQAGAKNRADGPEVVKQLDKLALWAQNLNDFDVSGLKTWGKIATGKYRFSILWNRFDPLTLKQAKFYYGRVVFYGSMPQFFSGTSQPLGVLVHDAQKWSDKITKDQKLRQKSLASASRSSAKK